MLESREAFLLDYGRKSAEAFRQSKEELFEIQNSRKARVGGLAGLRDAAFMARKAQDEAELKRTVQASARPSRAAAWDKIAEAKKLATRIALAYFYHERQYAFDSKLFDIARTLVRLGRRKGEAEFRSPQGISRIGAQIARARALLRSADLRRVRAGEARRVAGPVETATARRPVA